jgi:DeoR family transcriptional regulator of aga operon
MTPARRDEMTEWGSAALETSAKRSRRMADLLDAVLERTTVSVDELVEMLGTSPATVRRDLAELADRGLLLRTHGGARAVDHVIERPEALRDTRSRVAKQRIAQAVASILTREPQAIAVSGGTTTAEVARRLSTRNGLAVVTNSLTIASLMSGHPNRRVVMTGGMLRPQSFELVGSLAESAFTAIPVGTAILGADGVSAHAGATTHDEIEARTNHAMVAQARRTILVADGSKVGREGQARMAAVDEIDVFVTDRSADAAELDAIRATGIEVVVA